jgi:hypothetical protein
MRLPRQANARHGVVVIWIAGCWRRRMPRLPSRAGLICRARQEAAS